MFEDAPEALAGEELEIEYVSQIARAQRDGDAQALLKTIQSVSPLLEMTPQLMGVFNGERIIRNNARKFGLPTDELHTEEEMAEMQEQQAEQQAAEQEAALENQEADTLNKVAQAGSAVEGRR